MDKDNDPVNHPSHYTFGKFEVIDVLMDWFPFDPLLWQVAKYIARAKHKGNEIQDLKKAQFYLNKKIELREGKASSHLTDEQQDAIRAERLGTAQNIYDYEHTAINRAVPKL